MKKLFLIFALAILLIFAAGCNDDTAAEKFAKKEGIPIQGAVVEVTESFSEESSQTSDSVGEAQAAVCGNDICEGNESQERCPDCPSCNDFNRCTIDYFDVDDSRCKHTRRIPCCGDGECELSEQDLCIEDCGSEILLDDFPSPFIKDGDWNMFLVIGKKGTSSDVVAATSITEGLVFSEVTQGYSKYAKLDTELDSISGRNVILIGNPCTNIFIEQFMPYSGDCLEEFSQGDGLLKLFKTGSKTYALVVAGYDGDDLRRAAQILGNYRSAGLMGYQRKV